MKTIFKIYNVKYGLTINNWQLVKDLTILECEILYTKLKLY